jgi:hypothetical protein
MISKEDIFLIQRIEELRKVPTFRFIDEKSKILSYNNFKFYKIDCECGKIKKLIFKGHRPMKFVGDEKIQRDLKIDIISSNELTTGPIPPISDFCRNYNHI